MDNNYLQKMFIDEAKPALKRYAGSDGYANELVTALAELQPYILRSESVTHVASEAFKSRNVAEIDFPNATFVARAAFYDCHTLTNVNLPKVVSIDMEGFRDCTSLTSIDLPIATSIGTFAFSDCTSLTSANLPGIAAVNERVFINCESLTSVNLPNVTSIGKCAFYCARALTRIDLPNVTSIGESAFHVCEKLEAIIIRTTSAVCITDFSALVGTPIVEGTGHIYVPSDMFDQYRAAYESALDAMGFTGMFDIMFRKIEDYPEICG